MIALLLLACGSTPQPPQPRFVSLSPALTETLIALDAADQLAARSDWCPAPPAHPELITVGTSLTPDLERIAGLGPVTLLVDGSAGAALDLLRPLGPLEVLPWLTTDDVVASTRRLGALTGRDDPSAHFER